MEGCSAVEAVSSSSPCLSILKLYDLQKLQNMVLNCNNLFEVYMTFSNDCDVEILENMVKSLGNHSPWLRSFHIASSGLCDSFVLALASESLRSLRMLSLVRGSGITDASVAAIASGYPKLEVLDLSGSSISIDGIRMICDGLYQSLSRLHLASCPNVTSINFLFRTVTSNLRQPNCLAWSSWIAK